MSQPGQGHKQQQQSRGNGVAAVKMAQGQEAPATPRRAGTLPRRAHSPGRSPWSTSCTDCLCPRRGPGCPRPSGRERKRCPVRRLPRTRPPECTSGTRRPAPPQLSPRAPGGRPPPGCPGLRGEGRTATTEDGRLAWPGSWRSPLGHMSSAVTRDPPPSERLWQREGYGGPVRMWEELP